MNWGKISIWTRSLREHFTSPFGGSSRPLWIALVAFLLLITVTIIFLRNTNDSPQVIERGSRIPPLEPSRNFDGFLYVIEEGEVTIRGYKGPGGRIEIPSAIDGAPVTRIGYSVRDREFLYPQPEDKRLISEGAFNSGDIMWITIPETVIEVREGAFRDSPNLAAIDVAQGNQGYISIDGVLFDKDLKRLIQYPAGREDSQYAFPDGVEEIERWAFSGCKYLEDLKIPDSFKHIGDMAFRNCTSLKSVIIAEGVEVIGVRAFEDCVNLESIELPESLLEISNSAFLKCANLEHMSFGNNIKRIGGLAFFYCVSLKDVKIPASTEFIAIEPVARIFSARL